MGSAFARAHFPSILPASRPVRSCYRYLVSSADHICHPTHHRCASQVWADAPAVVNVVLKFFAELCFNRGQRIAFGNSSANGILLFREAATMGVGYGRRIAGFTPVRGGGRREGRGA